MQLRVYSREGCHLCEEALAAIASALPGTHVEVIDIERDDELHRRYLERIPVIEEGGTVLAELDAFRRPDFAERLRAAGAGAQTSY